MPPSTALPEIFLDLRDLLPPEPMERVLDALTMLQAGQRIRLLIGREPHPLYRFLDQNDYQFGTTQPAPDLYQVIIQER